CGIRHRRNPEVPMEIKRRFRARGMCPAFIPLFLALALAAPGAARGGATRDAKVTGVDAAPPAATKIPATLRSTGSRATVKVIHRPSPPGHLTATGSSPFEVTIVWSDGSSDEAGFKIERSIDGAKFVQIAQLLPNTTRFRDTHLFPNTAYAYRVRAF